MRRFSVFFGLILFVANAEAQDVNCNGCVNTGDVAQGAITASKLANGAVTKNKIQNLSIPGWKVNSSVMAAICAKSSTRTSLKTSMSCRRMTFSIIEYISKFKFKKS